MQVERLLCLKFMSITTFILCVIKDCSIKLGTHRYDSGLTHELSVFYKSLCAFPPYANCC